MPGREMRSRLVMLAVMAAAAAALLLVARREDALHRPLTTSGLLYPGLETAAVERLYVTLRGRQDLQFQREGAGAWRIVDPGDEYAKQEFVDEILRNLARAEVEPVEQADGAVRARDVGLDPPEYLIRFGDRHREETLMLGAVEPLGRMVYARRSGRPEIVLATRNLVTLLQSTADEFVDPTLLRGLAGPVDHVRVVDPDGVRLAASRRGEAWTVDLPEPVLGDASRLTTLVRNLAFVRHEDVVASRPTAGDLHAMGLPTDEDAAAGRSHGATLVELGAPGEPPVSAWLQAGWRTVEDGRVAARRSGSPKVVIVPQLSLTMLDNDAAFFRAHHLLPPVAERAEAVRIERDGATVLAIRRASDGSWSFELPERLRGEAVAAERVAGHAPLQAWLGRLDAVQAVGFRPPPQGEPVARLRVEWTRAGTTTVADAAFHAPGPDGVPVVTNERPDEGLLVPADVLDLLRPIQADLLRSLDPLDVDEAVWARLVLERPGRTPFVLVRRATDAGWDGDDEWSRRVAVGFDLLRGFRGLRWEPARPGAEHPWRVRFEDADGGVLAELALRRTADGEDLEVLGIPAARASVPGRPQVELAVAREWIERLDALDSAPARMQDG